jgi:hypothetical protein
MGSRRSKQRRTRRQTSESQRSLRNYAMIGAIVLGVVALGVLLYLSLRDPGVIDGLRRIAGLPRSHDDNVVYEDTGLPPAGGVHASVWQNCGIYTEPIDSANAAHSLEHGAVWVTYQPELEETDVELLQDLVRDERFVLLSPFPGLQSPVVLTAWGIQLEIDSADDGRIPEFIARYQQGPQTPELGASCINGVGTPIN